MCAIWGSNYFFTALALHGFNPVLLPLLRMAIATGAVAVIVAARRPPLPRDPRAYAHFAVLGALNIAGPFLLLTEAQRHVHSSTASILSATTPIFVFLLSWLVAGTERFDPFRGAGVIIAFLGVALLYGGDTAGSDAGTAAWSMVIVLCAMIFAAGNVYTRRFLAGVHPFTMTLFQLGVGTAYLLAAALATGSLHAAHPGALAVLAVIELGLLGSAVTYLLFFHFIQGWGSTAASLNTYFQPLVGLTLGVAVLGETIAPGGWIALGVVLAGILLFAVGSLRGRRWRGWPRTIIPMEGKTP
jgi:drug/metabolite transporter (DMT)-like permease